MTVQPLFLRISAVIKPIKPSPITTTVSPKVGFKRRTPCKPIEPITVNVASWSVTFSGIRATRF